MAKNSIRDYSATNSSNTDIQSIDISEGCSPAGINNAIREVMADLKDVSTGAVALESPAADSLSVTGDLTVDTNTLYVDSTNNRVGVGTSSPTHKFHTNAGTTNVVAKFESTDDTAGIYLSDNTSDIQVSNKSDDFVIDIPAGTEAMRISGGNLLVGKTSTSNAVAGVELNSTGQLVATVASGTHILSRNTTNGSILQFDKDGVFIGNIGNAGSRLYIADNTANMGISFFQSRLVPTNINGLVIDNVYDCGHPSYRWDDVYATNGTIQTSDANEKQQIAPLTDAEMTAAKAISALFKTFKWNDAVAKKGDAARTHAGVIAQDVEAAMTDAGLDAGDYAFFISSTWWETQTEVPAVEAVDAVLDEDGNVVTEAVEAQEAYTRTDTYETAEEAPEGAVERTRLGIRYPELLAFVGAATEQRLANIETRLAALEAN